MVGARPQSWPVDKGGWKEWQGVPDAPRPQVWGSGGLQGLRCRGGIGGRGTGPRDGANFATCVVEEKSRFLKDAGRGEESKGFGSGGVGGRGTGPRDGANFATCVL